jgi:hypothetical protein
MSSGGGHMSGGGGFHGSAGSSGIRSGGFVGSSGMRSGGFAGSSVNRGGGFAGGVGVRGGYGYGPYRGYGYRGYGLGFYGGYWPPYYGSYWPWYGYGYGYGYGYPSYGYDYGNDPYAYSYPNTGGYATGSYAAYDTSPNVTVVYPPPAQGMAGAAPPERVNPVLRQYDQYGQEMQSPSISGGASPIYLIAFRDHSIRAAASYWLDGRTLHYVTLQHEEKQTPLDAVDREFTLQLNRERRVPFQLPQ